MFKKIMGFLNPILTTNKNNKMEKQETTENATALEETKSGNALADIHANAPKDKEPQAPITTKVLPDDDFGIVSQDAVQPQVTPENALAVAHANTPKDKAPESVDTLDTNHLVRIHSKTEQKNDKGVASEAEIDSNDASKPEVEATVEKSDEEPIAEAVESNSAGAESTGSPQ